MGASVYVSVVLQTSRMSIQTHSYSKVNAKSIAQREIQRERERALTFMFGYYDIDNLIKNASL